MIREVSVSKYFCKTYFIVFEDLSLITIVLNLFRPFLSIKPRTHGFFLHGLYFLFFACFAFTKLDSSISTIIP
jgi:hypothetical protein